VDPTEDPAKEVTMEIRAKLGPRAAPERGERMASPAIKDPTVTMLRADRRDPLDLLATLDNPDLVAPMEKKHPTEVPDAPETQALRDHPANPETTAPTAHPVPKDHPAAPAKTPNTARAPDAPKPRRRRPKPKLNDFHFDFKSRFVRSVARFS